MAMNKVPTLVVGIGGIGCRMAANVADLLSEEDREYVGVVGLDTNVNDLKQLARRGIRTIQTSDARTVRDYMSEHFFSASWFPLNRFTAGKSMLNGAGQIRAVSRLAAVAAEEQGKFTPIKEEIRRIRRDNGQLTVMVLGSITGGTGAGLFLQLPYYLRKVLQEDGGKGDAVIRGMFVGPDMTADVQPSEINRNAVCVNGYACLKELNALYLRENGMPGIAPLKVDFYQSDSRESVEFKKTKILGQAPGFEYEDEFEEGLDEATKNHDAAILAAGNPNLPYDYLYLIESSYAEGTIGNTELTTVEELVGRMVYTLMFSPVGNSALSVEDNMVLQDMATRGMNRYSSAGICRLVYPMQIAREYVALANIRDMVRDEWLVLDEKYKADVAAIRDEQQTNSSITVPSIAENYCKNFKATVTSGTSPLSRLAGEAFVKVKGEDQVKAVDSFEKWLAAKIKAVKELPEIMAARDNCEVNEKDMLIATKAAKVIGSKKMAIEEFAKVSKAAVGQYATIANALFPPAWSMMAESRRAPENKENIYSLLYNVHPITARFFCYSLIMWLQETLAKKEKALRGINLLDYAEKEEEIDYDPKQQGNQSPEAAVANIKKNNYPIVGTYVQKGKLQKLATRFKESIDDQQTDIENYMVNALYVNVCKLLITRLEMLAGNYKIFFDSIADKIRLNDSRIEHLERLNLPLGQMGVLCSKEALESIADEFKNQNDGEMQQETKTAIFEQIYQVFEQEYATRGKVLTARQIEKNLQDKLKKLGQVFETAVVDTVRTSVVENGAGVVDITIRKALEKEYDLVRPDGMSLDEYVQSRVEEAMIKAAPMLAVDTNAMAGNTQMVYMALHPDCAEVQLSEDSSSEAPSAPATLQKLLPDIGEATDNLRPTVLLNESFSPYEITCFKTRYKFAIEDLIKYRDGSSTERCYRQRIAKIGTSPLNTGNPDDGLTVVPPHLDRNWHEEAYLPALSPTTQERNKRELGQAFVYGLGTDFFLRQTGEALLDNETGNPVLGWYYPLGDGLESPLKVKGTPVGTSYVELYRALPYLGRFKRHIMWRKAKESLAESMRYPSMEERELHLLEDEFICDLIQRTKTVTDGDKDAEGNILDIFLEMRASMKPEEWTELFDALLAVLQDFCKELYSYDTAGSAAVPVINRSVRTVLEEMVKNSEIGGKTEEELRAEKNFGGLDLYKQYVRIHKEVLKS